MSRSFRCSSHKLKCFKVSQPSLSRKHHNEKTKAKTGFQPRPPMLSQVGHQFAGHIAWPVSHWLARHESSHRFIRKLKCCENSSAFRYISMKINAVQLHDYASSYGRRMEMKKSSRFKVIHEFSAISSRHRHDIDIYSSSFSA